ALLLTQPLHFGDYAGLPMKLIWAVLDILTIAVLVGGLRLWVDRRRTPARRRAAELVPPR
ncbi:MAG: PepSY domain-containing protein, partial [Janthinobacterium lividum]